MSKATTEDDLTHLPKEKQTDADITAVLGARFAKDSVYTKIGENIVVTVNPLKPLEINSDSSVKEYSSAVRDGKDRAPHPFELAANAYFSLTKFKEDQSVLFVGDSGSGKSENYKSCLRQIVALSKNKKKEDKIAGRLLKSTVILDAFGNAKTIQNSNASRFGKCVELQINSRGRLAGAKISDYLHESGRVAHIPYGERTFHAFYYMLAGASSEEKTSWHLGDVGKFASFAASRSVKVDGINDMSNYAELKAALKALGFKDKYQTQIFQLLACILHLGSLEFVEGDLKEEAALIKNHELLDVVAEMLGVRPGNLENALVYKTKLIKKEICTIFLDKEESMVQRDSLSRTLYSLLWSFIVESINRRLCNDEEGNNFVALVDMFGLENLKDNYLHQMLYNFTAEKTLEFMNQQLFDHEIEQYRTAGISFAEISYGDNSEIVKLFTGVPNGVFPLIEAESARKKGKVSTVLETLNAAHESNQFFIPFKKSKAKMFGIKHYSHDVNYDAADFLEQNSEVISADFVTLFRGGSDTRESKNTFVAGLFSDKVLEMERAPMNDKAVVDVHQQNAPRRAPSTRRPAKGASEKGGDDKKAVTGTAKSSFLSHYCAALDELFDTVSATKISYVISMKPNAAHTVNKFDAKYVEFNVTSYGLSDIVKMRATGYNVRVPAETFIDRYRLVEPNILSSQASVQDKVVQLGEVVGWAPGSTTVSNNQLFLTEAATRALTLKLRQAEREEKKRLKEKVRGGADGEESVVDSQVTSSNIDQSDVQSDDGSQYSATEYTDDDRTDVGSTYGSEYSYMTSMEREAPGAAAADGKAPAQDLNFEEEEEEISRPRRIWLRITKILTFWIPNRCLEWNGMKRADIQQAWREKVALCLLVVLLSMLMLFFITGLSLIFCPRDNMYDKGELSQHKDVTSDLWIAVGGNIYKYTSMRGTHSIDPAFVDQYAGDDASPIFVRNPTECGLEDDGDPHDASFNASYAHEIPNSMTILNRNNKKIWVGYLAYMKDDLRMNRKNENYWWISLDGRIYDFSNYKKFNQRYLDQNNQFNDLLYQNGGGDVSKAFAKSAALRSVRKCMDLIHFAGMIDSRDTPQCIFANTLLISSTGVLVAIMVIKFLCALQLTSRREPEDYDRFVICQVPCYTEGEEQLRRTLDSLAMLRYDDKRKLLFIIADGNIVGSGNDRATWRIVLDILGVDPSIDPPKLSFQSLGEGNRQHNMGKIYTGLYDVSGHLIPYVVVVKVGKDSETRRPGNRGKRDSQMLLMHFLQKVHYDEPLSPLELEMYHQVKNVIGVDPSFYEFILMVDADTEVYPDSLNRMVAAMVHDAKVVGICGETTLANERDSWITMMQVYEYYISHHLAKAFESLFGSVTCLPGCFCMYRVRTPNKSIPLLIAKPVIEDYAVNNVDTLHKKNLLSLGEDRYLTTLMLKHFPNMKISFTQDAQCKTFAPDRWSVLLSQRRRWINSTVHNLAELLLLPQLCGFCCFSMRFIVFFDLFATLVMPATMAYLVYLIYEVAAGKTFPLVSLILIAAAYGLQVVIFVLKRKFEHIGWLIIYLLAMPLFTFIIPLYSFWHFDDFSWGNTRIVVGERGGRKQIIDEEPFDPNSIPVKRWTEYEQEAWEKESGATGISGTYVSNQSGTSGYTPSMIASPHGIPPPSYASSTAGGNQQRGSIVGAPVMSSAPQSVIYPSDEQVAAQIKTILATANLMTVTKKQVRDELSVFFNVDMMPRKDFINKVIEEVLQGKV